MVNNTTHSYVVNKLPDQLSALGPLTPPTTPPLTPPYSPPPETGSPLFNFPEDGTLFERGLRDPDFQLASPVDSEEPLPISPPLLVTVAANQSSESLVSVPSPEDVVLSSPEPAGGDAGSPPPLIVIPADPPVTTESAYIDGVVGAFMKASDAVRGTLLRIRSISLFWWCWDVPFARPA